MTMTVKQFERLKKVVGLMASPVDAEALAALRSATATISEAGHTWPDVLNRCIKVEVPVEAAPTEDLPSARPPGSKMQNGNTYSRDRGGAATRDPFARSIDEKFEELEDTPGWNDFVQSLRDQWDEKGWLSPAQREALFRREPDGRGQR